MKLHSIIIIIDIFEIFVSFHSCRRLKKHDNKHDLLLVKSVLINVNVFSECAHQNVLKKALSTGKSSSTVYIRISVTSVPGKIRKDRNVSKFWKRLKFESFESWNKFRESVSLSKKFPFA